MGEKLTKYNEKKAELNRISEDIIKYVLDADKIVDKAKTSLKPLERKAVEVVKKVEVNRYSDILVHFFWYVLYETVNNFIFFYMYTYQAGIIEAIKHIKKV